MLLLAMMILQEVEIDSGMQFVAVVLGAAVDRELEGLQVNAEVEVNEVSEVVVSEADHVGKRLGLRLRPRRVCLRIHDQKPSEAR